MFHVIKNLLFMNSNNRIQLIGNLRNDPDIRNFGNNQKLARFSLITQDIYKANGKLIKDFQSHCVVAWSRLAEIAEKNLIQGSEVVIDGKITTRSYKNYKGQIQQITEIVASSILFNNSKSQNNITEKRA